MDLCYTGKSTLLRALAVGVYDKVPGDGREFAVTDPGAVTIRAEDGRPVSGVDISPFISALPSGHVKPVAPPTTASLAQENGDNSGIGISGGKESGGGCNLTAPVALEAKEIAPADKGGKRGPEQGRSSTQCFSTGGASGSTSQAANVMEALEAGATALMLDEDTCAGNVGGGLSNILRCIALETLSYIDCRYCFGGGFSLEQLIFRSRWVYT